MTSNLASNSPSPEFRAMKASAARAMRRCWRVVTTAKAVATSRRRFTSTTTNNWPYRAIISNSPTPARKSRAKMREPFRRNNTAAIISALRPAQYALRRGFCTASLAPAMGKSIHPPRVSAGNPLHWRANHHLCRRARPAPGCKGPGAAGPYFRPGRPRHP